MAHNGDAGRMHKLTEEAVSILATGPGSLRERLSQAYFKLFELSGLPISPWDDLQEKYEQIHALMQKWIPADAMDGISYNDELSKIADKILGLFVAVNERVTQLRDISKK